MPPAAQPLDEANHGVAPVVGPFVEQRHHAHNAITVHLAAHSPRVGAHERQDGEARALELDGGTVASLKPSLAEAVERYRAEWPTQVLKKQESASEDAQFDRIFSVRLKSKAGEALASSARLASAAAALLGVHCVRFYQDQLFVKVSIH